ncbi:MAG: 2-phospho-L-lactate transferase [Nitriliruptoraceae bacterium]
MITVLAGGIGGARFIRGVAAAVGADKVTAIVNVGDDLDHVGLRVCPDLDSITYWLAGVVHPEQQWGRADEHHVVSEELARFGHPRWFTLGDRDLAVHLHRTHLMRQGVPLSRATDEIRQAFGIDVQLLPATDDPVATRIKTADGRDLAFQEYWVREQASPVVTDVYLSGASLAAPAPGVLDAIHRADTVLIAPSNPVVSIGTILAIPGIDDAVRSTSAPVVGVSPIIGGKVVRGMADRLLPAVGAQVSADGVARHYGSLLDGWVIDEADRNLCATIEASGITCQATDTMLDDIEVARTVALTCLQLAAELAEQGHRP